MEEAGRECSLGVSLIATSNMTFSILPLSCWTSLIYPLRQTVLHTKGGEDL